MSTRRTPSGVRGLKSVFICFRPPYITSHPVRGAWIEIINVHSLLDIEQSHPVRGAWIEINYRPAPQAAAGASHPVRGAWIEIPELLLIKAEQAVAPRQGCVD